ncbi:MAG: alpha/beta hydrolase [Mesorhizobium amorphae]|nr:MAG: alpha/beta hydrolase [Mesorhizobium amorphae]
MAQQNGTALNNVVLVHGAFADGSGWRAVYDRLVADGYRVSITQHSTATLDGDIATVKRVIAAQDGPVVLVGHSYGGAVITGAGNDPKVKALVYIAAFAPNKGETVLALASKPVPGATPPPFLPPNEGFLTLDVAKFPEAFAQDVEPAEAKFMAASQLPWGEAAAGAATGEPAWRSKPAWTLVTTEDRMIPPATQEMMAGRAKAKTEKIAASHAVFLSHPDKVAALIEEAARGAAGQ